MRATLALIFFLSGASALIFESLWFRLAGLALGNSVWSASLVLAAFMGGLALGNGLAAKLHNRVLQPVRLYAVLEFTIGISGIAVVLILAKLPELLGPVLGGLTDTPLVLNAMRVIIAFVILVTPAIAMGATLPVLAKALSRQDSNFGANIGWLYGWNTLGAMIAAFCTALILVPTFGILVSGFIAFVFNMIAAAIALQYPQGQDAPLTPEPSMPPAPEAIDGHTRRYLTIACMSGALMLALEVVWFRFLLLTSDGTSLIFAVMLAVVLAGIAAGGFMAAHLFRRDERAYRWLKHVTAASAALVVLTYWGYDYFTEYRNQNETTTAAFVGYATFLMFPVALLSGVAFTMVNRAVKDQFGASARTAGITTFYNTIGAMFGSLGAGFILLPLIGMELSFFLVAATYCLLVFVVPPEDQTSRVTFLAGRGVVALAATALVFFPFGLMQGSYLVDRVSALPGHLLISTREGLTETIRYFSRDVYGKPKYYRLATNGHSMSATSTAAKRYMKLYVYLPIALKPDTRDALLISYGVGSTAKALTDSSGLESIDIVDISKDILEMNAIIYPGDESPLQDERVNVHIEDGRFFLNTTAKRYDLITSEPPPPKIAGVVNLYSEEYFKLIRERLHPGGYASYWLPVQQLEPTDTLAITKAFCNAFDDCSLWSGGGLEWMLLGSNNAGMQSDASQMAGQWRDPMVNPELVALGFESAAQLGSLFMADADYLANVTATVQPVTDNYPARISSRLVNNLGHVELYDTLMDESQRLQRFRNSELINERWPEELRYESERYFPYERLIKNHLTGNAYRQVSDTYSWEAIDDVLTNTSLMTLPLWLLGSDHATQEILDGLLESDGYRSEFGLDMARRYTADRDYKTAFMYLHDHFSTAGEVTQWKLNFYLYLLGKNGRVEQARPVLSRLESQGGPEIDRFLEWYSAKFGLSVAANSGLSN
jgi:predicted membrane-bound spermidine synthase